MAGDVTTLASEDALLQDDYSHARSNPTKRKTKKRPSTSHTERPMAKGFKAVQKSIAAKSGVPMANAGAILASASRNASPAAKKKNPALKKVKGKAKAKSAPKAKPYAPSPIAQAMGAANC